VDTIATIIFTAFANIIITGIVSNLIFFRYQKRIENTFAKSSFEHQTKFAQLYAKRAETLANLYQKFMAYKAEFGHMTAEASRVNYDVDESGKTQMEFNQGENIAAQVRAAITALSPEVDKKFADFVTYFDNNRLYLTDNICLVIENIQTRHDLMEFVTFMFYDNAPDELIGAAKSSSQALGFKFNIPQDLEKPDLLALIQQMDGEVTKQAKSIERLYKSTAETQ